MLFVHDERGASSPQEPHAACVVDNQHSAEEQQGLSTMAWRRVAQIQAIAYAETGRPGF